MRTINIRGNYTNKIIIIVMFLIFVTFAVVYRFKEKSQSVTDLALSFFFGVVVQCVMTLLYQVRKRTHPSNHFSIVKAVTDDDNNNDIEMKTCSTPLKSTQ